MSVRPHAVCTASFLFAVTGPSMNDHFGPPRLRSRSCSKVPLALPALEHLELERVRVGLLGQRVEHALRFYGGGINPACRAVNLECNSRRKELELALEATETTFEEVVLEREGKVIVDFWAEWCGPCHAVAPVLDRIADEHDDVKIVKVNVDQEQGLAQRYGVSSIPLMVLFENGEPQAQALGALPKGALERGARPQRRARAPRAPRRLAAATPRAPSRRTRGR